MINCLKHERDKKNKRLKIKDERKHFSQKKKIGNNAYNKYF